MMSELIERRAKYVEHMDNVIRCVNDEENGVFETWLMGGPPDGCSREELLEFVEDEDWYRDVCQLFAELISELIDKGEWTEDGFSYELYRSRRS